MEYFKKMFKPKLSKCNSCSYLQFIDEDNEVFIGWKSERSLVFKKMKFLLDELEYQGLINYSYCDLNRMMHVNILGNIEPEDNHFVIEI